MEDEDIEVDETPLLVDHVTELEDHVVKTRAGLVSHASEPGGPAIRTRSTTTATGRKYFWQLENGKRMRNEHQCLADWGEW